jgi:hypothetical protein
MGHHDAKIGCPDVNSLCQGCIEGVLHTTERRQARLMIGDRAERPYVPPLSVIIAIRSRVNILSNSLSCAATRCAWSCNDAAGSWGVWSSRRACI